MMIFIFVVNLRSKMIEARSRQTILLVQEVKDSFRFLFNQLCMREKTLSVNVWNNSYLYHDIISFAW